MMTCSRVSDFHSVANDHQGVSRVAALAHLGFRIMSSLLFGHSEQVVRRTAEEGGHLRSCLPDESCLAQAAHRLEPAEDLLDPFSLALTDPVAFGAGGPTIEPRRLATLDACDMRTNPVFAQMGHEILHVIALVGAKRLWVDASAPGAGEHRARGAVFGLCRVGHEDIDAQPAAVLHEHMPAVTELRRLALALAHESRLRVRRAFVGGVRALLALEVGHPAAVITVLGRRPVLASEALERGPRVDQGAIDGEMIRRQERPGTNFKLLYRCASDTNSASTATSLLSAEESQSCMFVEPETVLF